MTLQRTEGAYQFPLKIQRNSLFPSLQRFLWYLLCFGPLHTLGGSGKFCFFDCRIKTKRSFQKLFCIVCRGFLVDGKILYLERKHTLKEFEMVRNNNQEVLRVTQRSDSKVVLNTRNHWTTNGMASLAKCIT